MDPNSLLLTATRFMHFMKLLIFGNGQFASLFKNILTPRGHDIVIVNTDIRKLADVKSDIEANQPDVVINTAAHTNLDWCEQHRLECFDSNVLGADTVAQACQETNSYFMHVSTGCMQESLTPEDAHREEDPANPTSFYSWTKYWADQMIMNRVSRSNLKALILRPRQPVSGIASPRNALVKMLTFSKFIDTPNSITVLEDFIDTAEQMLAKKATGIFNVANPGVMSPYRIALLLKEYVKPELEINLISKEELNRMTLAQRIDSVLDCSKLVNAGVTLKPAEERLREILPQLKKDLEARPEIFDRTNKDTIEKLSLKSVKRKASSV